VSFFDSIPAPAWPRQAITETHAELDGAAIAAAAQRAVILWPDEPDTL
jgi:hypothetical protein